MLANNLCKKQILKRKLLQKQSLLISTSKTIEEIDKILNKYKPYLFCINDVENGQDDTRKNLKVLLNKMFPQKAEWEI